MLNRLRDPVFRFRVVSLLEGLSYLVLLGIAMPLKYLADDPRAVQSAGRIHGLLFVLFALSLTQAMSAGAWSTKKTLRAFVLSLLPFGALVFEFVDMRQADDAPPK